jgi:hypothetical protein
MATISSSSSDEKQSTLAERRVILIGFDRDRVKEILVDESITKLVIFDDDDDVRTEFEKVYPIYKNRITLYEGAIESNLNGYYKLREKEGITPEMHTVLDNHRLSSVAN